MKQRDFIKRVCVFLEKEKIMKTSMPIFALLCLAVLMSGCMGSGTAQKPAEGPAQKAARIAGQKTLAAKVNQTDINGLFASAGNMKGQQVTFSVQGPLGFKSSGKADLVPVKGKMLKLRACKSPSKIRKMEEEYGLKAEQYKSKDLKKFNEKRGYTVQGLVTKNGVTNYMSMGKNPIPSGRYAYVSVDVLSIK